MPPQIKMETKHIYNIARTKNKVTEKDSQYESEELLKVFDGFFKPQY